ncbi:hypothetical protein [Streptomyces sp. TP-A0356]|uniref:hypothetical protein n=1 Tax=Streptomyces sp. TP-A0356 TaxID=1359208 RepID=UPI0006E29BC3|nr:hypothetical protein [Streptomyces sp. TP-A0356]
MHDLIASPFLEQHVLLRPGHKDGLLLPEENYEELRAHDPAQPAPAWLAHAVRDQWGMDGIQHTGNEQADACGPVIEDPQRSWLIWLVPPGTSDQWGRTGTQRASVDPTSSRFPR